MGLAGTVALHSLLGRPGRTLFSVLGIAMGIATVVAVVVLDHNTILGLSAPFQTRGTPDIELRVAPGSDTGSLQLADIEGVSLLARFFQHEGVARRNPLSEVRRDAKRGRRITLMAIEAAHAADFGVYQLASGRHLDPDAEGREVLIGSRLAGAMKLSEGDSLWLSRSAKPGRKRCVDGVLMAVEGPPDQPVEYDFEVVGILTNEKIGRRSGGMVTVVDFERGEEVYRGTQVDRRWWGVRDQDVDVERLKASLAHSYSYQLDQAAILGQAADERAFRTGVRMAGLLALILGLYVIFHTLSMSLTERIGEVGTLHALGCTRTQVARIFLLEALALAGGGAAFGILGGIALAKLLLALGITTLGTGKHVDLFLVPWGAVLALAALGFGIAMAGSVYPLVSLRGANTVRALRGEAALEKRRMGFGFQLLYAFLLVLVLPAVYLVIVPVVGNLTAELTSILLGAFGLLALLMVLSMVVPTVLSAACTLLTRPFARYWPLSGLLTTRAMRQAPARIGVSMSSLALVTAGLVGLK
ncbi:MAG: ABC transporter permease, partial [Planctomycetota bacterium]